MSLGEHPVICLNCALSPVPAFTQYGALTSDCTCEGPTLFFCPQNVLRNRCRIVGVIGDGSFSVVLRGTVESKTVAVKVLLPRELFQEPNNYEHAVKCFEREAEALKELSGHPGLPAYVDYGDECIISRPRGRSNESIHGVKVLAMELVSGKEIGKGSRLVPGHIRDLLFSVLETLSYLHGKGYLHRDISPSNVLLDESGRHARLIDLGLTKGQVRSSIRNTLWDGTSETRAPEVTSERSASCSSDIYAMGATLIYGLTGLILTGDWHSWSQKNEEVYNSLDPDVARVLDRMVEPKRRDRYQTAEEALADLRRPVPREDLPPGKKGSTNASSHRDLSMWEMREVRHCAVVDSVQSPSASTIFAVGGNPGVAVIDSLSSKREVLHKELGPILNVTTDSSGTVYGLTKDEDVIIWNPVGSTGPRRIALPCHRPWLRLAVGDIWWLAVNERDQLLAYSGVDRLVVVDLRETSNVLDIRNSVLKENPSAGLIFGASHPDLLFRGTSDGCIESYRIPQGFKGRQTISLNPLGRCKMGRMVRTVQIALSFSGAAKQKEQILAITDGLFKGTQLLLLDSPDLTERRRLSIPGESMSAVAFDPNLESAVLGTNSGKVFLYSIERDIFQEVTPSLKSGISSVTSSKGALVATSFDGTIRLFEV